MTVAANAEPKRKPRRLWMPITALSATAVIGTYFWIARDVPPQEAPDLTLTPHAVRPGENAYEVLVATAAGLDVAPWRSGAELFTAIAQGEYSDETKSAALLAANEAIWPDFVRAASLTISQGPIPRFPDGPGRSDFGGLLGLARLAALRAWSLHRAGNTAEACAWLCVGLRAAQRIEHARSDVGVWLVGMLMHGVARQEVERIAVESSLSSASAAELIRTLEETRPSATALADALRAEHAAFRRRLHHVVELKSTDAGAADAFVRSLAHGPPPPVFILKPHRTALEYAQLVRQTIALLESDWLTIAKSPPSRPAVAAKEWWRDDPRNAAGRALIAQSLPELHELLEKRIQAQTAISMLQTLIALRQHQQERGGLPEKLAELVPGAFPRVPLDYYDGRDLKFSKQTRKIWSTGRNGLLLPRYPTIAMLAKLELELPPDSTAPARSP